MEDNLQPKLPLNQELLRCRYGHNYRHAEKFVGKLQSMYACCQSSALTRVYFRKLRRTVCEYCTRTDCLYAELKAAIHGTDLETIRNMIGFLKQHGLFSYEDFALVNPEDVVRCKEKEKKIRLLEDEIRMKYNIDFFLYRDLFSATSKEYGWIEKSPYEIKLVLWIKLVETFPKYYSGMQGCLVRYYKVYDACIEASGKIPNFYKTLFADVYGQSKNVFFEGLHPVLMSRLLNKYNEAETGALDQLFSMLGYSPSEIFEKMDKYEVCNMEFFQGKKIKKNLLEKYASIGMKKKYPVVYAYAKKALEGEV